MIFPFINLKKFGLGIAIIIVFSLFINYGIGTFYKAPKYDDFCKPELMRKAVNTKGGCEEIGGIWTENMNYRSALPPAPTIVEGIKGVRTPSEAMIGEPVGWCDAYFSCQKSFQEANDIYKRNVFVIWMIVGMVAIVASFFLVAIKNMSVAFTFAGLVSFLIGTIVYWSARQDYFRFVILGIVLAVLIYIGYKKLKDTN